jgi:hypothetical protein
MHFRFVIRLMGVGTAFLSLSSIGTPLFAQIDFNRQIRPILAEHCFHCHGPDATQRGAELRLDLESEAKRSVIVAGAVDQSELIHRIDSTDGDVVMPPTATGKVLTEAQKNDLRQWIAEGAKYSDHWAFQPIGNAEELLSRLPEAVATGTSPIDRFLLHRLQAAGLSYSNPISRMQFIRRATFDLTGLPPTWGEVEAFLQDESEGNVERLIDRLLESPRYGERWGRHWLDIARYADTHGGAAIGFTSFPFSYTYRDYVIRSFHHDLPVDRFLMEQIAADQLGLPDGDPSLAALGFLTVGMQFRNFHDTIDDQIDVITRGLMGLTVTCARCHDHKFDSIPTADYYALYAAIAPSKSPAQLPTIGEVSDEQARQTYQKELQALSAKLQQFAREQSEILRNRLRMQVGLYLTEIAKGISEQDTSTQFLSYRTDDIRPVVFNRWIKYLNELPADDPVFAPWIAMRGWSSLPVEEFQNGVMSSCRSLPASSMQRADPPINCTRFAESLPNGTHSSWMPSLRPSRTRSANSPRSMERCLQSNSVSGCNRCSRLPWKPPTRAPWCLMIIPSIKRSTAHPIGSFGIIFMGLAPPSISRTRNRPD